MKMTIRKKVGLVKVTVTFQRNLELLSRAAHTSHHRPHRKPCLICGKDDVHQSRGLCAIHRQQVEKGKLCLLGVA